MTANINKEYLITQRTFRALMQAMSRPGRIYNIGDFSSDLPAYPFIYSSLMLVLQSLLDHEVAFSIIGYVQDSLEAKIIRISLEAEIIRITGSCPAAIEDADFVIVPSGDSKAALLKAKRGDLKYPDGGATAIYLIRSLADGNNKKSPAVLKGPGINGEISPFIEGLGRNEFSYLKEINSEYPVGVDCIFVDSIGQVMCIPRSTRILLKRS